MTEALKQAALPPLPAPDSYLFQHDETGQTMFVDGQQVEWGFEANNPRLHKVGGAFTEAQMHAYARTALTQATASEQGELWGWAIIDKHGTAQAIRPLKSEFFGAIQEQEPFAPEDLTKMDREWQGLAPHSMLTLYTAQPAPAARPMHPKRSAEQWQEIAELEDLAGGVFAAGALVPQTARPMPEERTAFESWTETQPHGKYPLKRDQEGQYWADGTEVAWDAWQARALIGSQPTAPAVPAEQWPKLEKPATVGAGTFGVGVSSRLVVEAAQRSYEYRAEQVAKTKEQMQADEANRRALWDMLHAAPAAVPAVPDGWSLVKKEDERIVVKSPNGDAWAWSNEPSAGTSNDFVYAFLNALLASAPTSTKGGAE